MINLTHEVSISRAGTSWGMGPEEYPGDVGRAYMADEQATWNFERLSSNEEGAFGLSKAAVMLDQARDEQGRLAAALDNNMEVWVAIRTLVNQKDNPLPDETKQNLMKLSQFVTQTTMAQGVEMPPEVLDTFININLQISEGLLEARSGGA